MGKVFVSHATADAVLIEEFVEEILKGCGLNQQQIFASSIPGMGAQSGEDLLHRVRSTVGTAGLVVAVISPTYVTRPICLAELGAAWAISGRLYPVLVPGMHRDSLNGVLSGMKVDYLDDETALDELAERIEEVTNATADRPTWTRKKRRWLEKVAELSAGSPNPKIVTSDDHERALLRISDLEAALHDAEREIAQLDETLEKVQQLKDADEVRRLILPDDDVERFHALREVATDALADLSPAVRDAVRMHVTGRTMSWPDAFEEQNQHFQVREAVDDGYLVDNEVWIEPNVEFGQVKRAVVAVKELREELEGDGFTEDFYTWFEQEFDGPPDLTSRVIWRQLFPDL